MRGKGQKDEVREGYNVGMQLRTRAGGAASASIAAT